MEVIVYAILAFFIFSRLYVSLGRVSVEREMKFRAAEIREILDQKAKSIDQLMYVEKENLSEILSAKKEIESSGKSFSTDQFMEGAERAFELFISAFASCDLKILARLLSKDAFAIVSRKINERKSRGNTLERTLVALQSKSLLKLNVAKGMIYATVKFVSEQISLMRDEAGSIVSGDKDTIEVIEDLWVFERCLSSASNSWTVSQLS
ncbi:tim44-like domain protein [Neorickettsia helminthoeca str. Oregon]|uniref:Large ribosomal subunit protein mL45 n=2 Tax=Neorickettsia helminthoeca TaxID=33994 RepID=X5HJM7_9RICK|nr:tim44-like domain protein [Neorickettsia helminthoeca str. Oregon]